MSDETSECVTHVEGGGSVKEVCISKQKLLDAKTVDAKIESDISGIRNQMLTQSLSEQFVDNVVKETLLHIDNISVMQITKAINDTTI